MYVKETYIPVRRRKRRKRFPAMIAGDMDSSFYLFNALNANNIKKYKTNQKCNPKKKKPRKIQSTVSFDATPVDLKTMKENKKKNKKQETIRKEHVPAVKKYKFFQPEVKAFSDVTFSPNTTFDRLLHSSRKPLVDKNSVVNVNHQIKPINTALLSPAHFQLKDKGGNRTSTPILISPIFPAVTVRNKQRNILHLKEGGRENLLTPVSRNNIESFENSPQHFSSFVAASDSTSLPSPLLGNRDCISCETERLHNKIVPAHKCGDTSFSPIAARTRSSVENENISYKITHAQDYSQSTSGIKIRLRRTAASEKEGHSKTDGSFNSDESFFSSVKVQHKRNKKTENQCNKNESIRSSDNFLSANFRRSKRASENECKREKTTVAQKTSAVNSDESSGSDNACHKRTSDCKSDESIQSSVRVKRKRNENRYHTRSNDQNHERLTPLVRRSQQNESGSNFVNTTCDRPKGTQFQFAITCESPDMFSSVDEIETDIVPSKCVIVVEKYNSNFSTFSSNDKNTSSRNASSSSVITDYSHDYHESCRSSVEIKCRSDMVMKSSGIKINSQVNNMLGLTNSVHAGPSDSTIVSSQYSDCDNAENELCAGRHQSLETEFDSGQFSGAIANKILMTDASEVNDCDGSTQKTVGNYTGAAAVSSATSHISSAVSHIGTCSPSDSERCSANVLPLAAEQEEESDNLSNVLCRSGNSHELRYCKGQSLTHSTSVYYEENAEKSHCTRSRRSSLCRRLSHVVIPERRTRENSNSREHLPMFDKRSCTLSVSVIFEDDELVPEVDTTLSRGLVSARDMVLGRCNQSEPLTFDKAFPQRFFDNCKKIGEGLYGEVFFCQENCTPGRVLKIIPIEGAILVNGEKQKKYNEVLSELVIALELSNLRHDAQFKTNCFVEVARCVCVQGKYPQRLIDLWNEYHEEKVSENDSPTIFDDNQLFLIFELADGGKALESYCFTSAAQAFSAFVQLTFALAVAEITLEFEHRDLHWGNVLISKTPAKHIAFKLNGKEFLVPANGIQVTIIDYTLSRMSYGGCCIFNDLAVDPDLFISQGDYQFEVYRLMQNAVKNEWNHFRPYTNMLWLHYILGKMLQGVHYKNISTKIHKKFKTKLTNSYNDVLKYNSAYELVTNGNLLEMMK